MKRVLAVIVVLSWGVAAAGAGEMKATRISLFSSGVGYFEAAETVEGNTSAEMNFRVEQINDILKSLVLRDMDGGTIGAVEYPSRDPVERTLKSFAVDITGKPTLGQLLDQLRGVQVQVLAATPVSGAILSVEKQRSMMRDGTIIESELLSIMSDAGLKLFEDEFRTPIHLEDAARACIEVAQSDFHGILHAAGPQRLSRLEMGRLMAKSIGCSDADLIPTRQSELIFPEPRPQDVSLDSSKYAALFHHPPGRAMSEALEPSTST